MDWIQLVSSVGFPVVACVGMAWFVKYQTDINTEETRQMRLEHKEEVNRMTEAVNNNTIAIQRLLERMDKND